MSKHSHTSAILITLFEAEEAVQMYLCQCFQLITQASRQKTYEQAVQIYVHADDTEYS